jgi:hypothetical protein
MCGGYNERMKETKREVNEVHVKMGKEGEESQVHVERMCQRMMARKRNLLSCSTIEYNSFLIHARLTMIMRHEGCG